MDPVDGIIYLLWSLYLYYWKVCGVKLWALFIVKQHYYLSQKPIWKIYMKLNY